jgi:hypothetical protein
VRSGCHEPVKRIVVWLADPRGLQIGGVLTIGAQDVVEEPILQVVDGIERDAGDAFVEFAVNLDQPCSGVDVFEAMRFGVGIGGLFEERFFVSEVMFGDLDKLIEVAAEDRPGRAGGDGVVEMAEEKDHFPVLAVDRGDS